MGRRGVARVVAVAVAVLVPLAAGCGSSGSEVGSSDEAPAPTSFPPGTSGAFVVDPAPEGWQIERANADVDNWYVYYSRPDDRDRTFSVLSFAIDPSDPQYEEWRRHVAEGGGETGGVATVSVGGHEAYLGPLRDDGRTYGDQVTWFPRPDLAVQVGVPFDSGLDVVEVANDAHEIDGAAFTSLVEATSGGGQPGPRLEALRGEIDGDEWVLTAVLPEGYPVEPIDLRRGCAELTYRGESATTCGDLGGRTFTPLDEGRQAILGDVVFVFGVIGDGNGDVVVGQPERPDGTWQQATAAVLPEAPDLTWFVTTYDDVCDRLAGSDGELLGIVVPDGYPHRNDCAV